MPPELYSMALSAGLTAFGFGIAPHRDVFSIISIAAGAAFIGWALIH